MYGVKVWRSTDYSALGLEPLLPLFKATGTVHGYSTEMLLALFRDQEFKLAQDKDLARVEEIEELASDARIFWCEEKFPWPFSNRDAVYIEAQCDDAEEFGGMAGECVHCQLAVDYPKLPPTKRFCRRRAIGGTLLQQKGTNVQMTIIVCPLDLGGGLPTGLINAFIQDKYGKSIGEMADWLNRDEGQTIVRRLQSVQEGS